MVESHCFKIVDKILSDRSLSKFQKIELLQSKLQEINSIDLNTVKLINRCFKGLYASEYLVIQKDYEVIIEFYQFLQLRFYDIYEISLSLADLLLLNHQYKESLNIFNQVFIKKPLLIFEAPSELLGILEKYGSNAQKISYYLSLVRAFVEDQNFEDALAQYEEVIQRYGDNNKYVIEYIGEYGQSISV